MQRCGRFYRRGKRFLGQDTIAVCVCRKDEQMHKVTTLVQDPETNGNSFQEWAKLCDLLWISEHHQRELIILSVMMEQPTFEPLDMLVGQVENPCRIADTWTTRGKSSGSIHIAGNWTQGDTGECVCHPGRVVDRRQAMLRKQNERRAA
jgi:hypothetical protein